jgi:hypothetical protein
MKEQLKELLENIAVRTVLPSVEVLEAPTATLKEKSKETMQGILMQLAGAIQGYGGHVESIMNIPLKDTVATLYPNGIILKGIK